VAFAFFLVCGFASVYAPPGVSAGAGGCWLAVVLVSAPGCPVGRRRGVVARVRGGSRRFCAHVFARFVFVVTCHTSLRGSFLRQVCAAGLLLGG